MQFQNKLVAILNKDIDTGIVMNALAHMSLSIGAQISKDELFLKDYKDSTGNVYFISGMPFIILKGKSNEIRKAIVAAKENGVVYNAFTETMTGGSYLEQLERTALLAEGEHQYYGLVLWGKWEIVSTITKKFSLFS